MNDELLVLILLAICLAGIPLDGEVKQILYVIFAALGLLVFFGFSIGSTR